MTQMKLDKMTTEELVGRFVRIALDQDKAIRYDDNATFNRLFDQMNAIEEELKGAPRRSTAGFDPAV
jgi:hypothetical protein